MYTRTLSALLRRGLMPRTVELVCFGAYLATIDVLNHSSSPRQYIDELMYPCSADLGSCNC